MILYEKNWKKLWNDATISFENVVFFNFTIKFKKKIDRSKCFKINQNHFHSFFFSRRIIFFRRIFSWCYTIHRFWKFCTRNFFVTRNFFQQHEISSKFDFSRNHSKKNKCDKNEKIVETTFVLSLKRKTMKKFEIINITNKMNKIKIALKKILFIWNLINLILFSNFCTIIRWNLTQLTRTYREIFQ